MEGNLVAALVALAVGAGSMGWAVARSVRGGGAWERELELGTSLSWFDIASGSPEAAEMEVLTVSVRNRGHREAVVTSIAIEDLAGARLSSLRWNGDGESGERRLQPGAHAEYSAPTGELAKAWAASARGNGAQVVVATATGRRYRDPLDAGTFAAIGRTNDTGEDEA